MPDSQSDQSPASDSTYYGACSCRTVSYRVTGKPVLSAYCHCTLCRQLNACPFIHTIHFPSSSFSWTHVKPYRDSLDFYEVSDKPWKKRWRCRICGTNVASYNSNTDNWSVWGALLERDEEARIIGWEALKPTAHMFYGTRMLDVDDGLGKWSGYENVSRRLA